jgi:hypothetical protein
MDMYVIPSDVVANISAYRNEPLGLSTYGSTALVDVGCFFSFLIYTQSIGLLGRGSAHRKAATYIQDNTNKK